MCASTSLRFARESRSAMVGSLTRNARAISAVLKSAERAQRQRDASLHRKRRMAAREHQAQSVIVEGAFNQLGLMLLRLEAREARQVVVCGRRASACAAAGRSLFAEPPW